MRTQPLLTGARLVAEPDGSLVLYSRYDRGLVDALRVKLPSGSRRWDASRRGWVIDPAVALNVADLCERYLGIRPAIPAVDAAAPVGWELRLLTVEYVGAARERPDGTVTATGWADLSGRGGRGDWSVVFPVEVLRAFWEPGAPTAPPARERAPQTLYAVLCVDRGADEGTIRQAFRRLARATHPDVCKEPDAAERFIALKAAYDVLSDARKRHRYDVGLLVEADVAAAEPLGVVAVAPAHYRAPLPCGLVLARGSLRLGQFWVAEIVQWEDVVAPDGSVLVTSWPAGAEAFERRWVRP